MKNKIFIILFIVVLNSCSLHTLREKIEGNIYNSKTKKPIAGIYILSYQLDTLSITNYLGHFEISPITERSISWPGLEKKTLPPYYDWLILKKGTLTLDTIRIYDQNKAKLLNGTLIFDSIFVQN